MKQSSSVSHKTIPSSSDIAAISAREDSIKKESEAALAAIRSQRAAMCDQRAPFHCLCQGRLDKIGIIRRVQDSVTLYRRRADEFDGWVDAIFSSDGGDQESWRGVMNDPALFHAERLHGLAVRALERHRGELAVLNAELVRFAKDTGLESELPPELQGTAASEASPSAA